MKTKTEVRGITHDDLVTLLSAATYDNPNLWVEIMNKGRHSFTTRTCREDAWAEVLLKSDAIKVVDMCSSYDNGERYDEYAFKDEDTGCAAYPLILKDIEVGLARCLDKEVTCHCGEESSLRDAAINLMDGSSEFDAVQAYNLLQAILFNEIIY